MILLGMRWGIMTSALPEYIQFGGNVYDLRVAVDRPLYFIPHDLMRYDYDDPLRLHSLGWQYNPSTNGARRDSAATSSQPEVYRVSPWQGFQFTDPWQTLLAEMNPALSREKALSLLNPARAFCNGEFARFDGTRLMGGWTVTGREQDGKLWIDTLRVDQPIPSVQSVLSDQTKWGWFVSVRPDGLIGLFHLMGLDGLLHPCRFPVVSSTAVWVPLDEVLPVREIHAPQWMG